MFQEVVPKWDLHTFVNPGSPVVPFPPVFLGVQGSLMKELTQKRV